MGGGGLHVFHKSPLPPQDLCVCLISDGRLFHVCAAFIEKADSPPHGYYTIHSTKPIKMQISQHSSMIVVQVGLRLVIIKGQSNMCSLMLNLLGTGLWASHEYRL